MEEIKNLKFRYKNKLNEESIADDFLRPCLKHFCHWRRSTLNFTSSALKTWAGSLQHIVRDDVKIEILCDIGHVNDKDLLKTLEHCATEEDKALTLRIHNENILLTALKADMSSGQGDEFRDYKWKLLHWLIAKGKLEIKFGLNQISDHGSYHEKHGYFKFPNGACIAHYGSFNESETGHRSSNESVHLYSSYKAENDEARETTINDVDEDWNGSPSVKVYPLSRKTLQKIKDSAPDRRPINPTPAPTQAPIPEPISPERKLRIYQEEAITNWFDNDCRGILEHATGSGKTFTAMNMIERTFKEKGAFCVIGVPVIPLAEQWVDELNDFFKNKGINYEIIECWSDHKDFIQESWFKLIELQENHDGDKLLIYVVVNDTLGGKFQEIFSKDEFRMENCLFIGDECHRYATANKLRAIPKCNYRLGLSATPIVDELHPNDGEIGMQEYFGGICHTFTLEDAIPDYLCNYYYYPVATYLDENEFKTWEELYKKSGWKDGTNEYALDEGTQGNIYREMANVLSSAQDKIRALLEILPNDEEEKMHSLFFCGQGKGPNGERDIVNIATVLREKGWDPSRITYEENRIERPKIIKNFRDGITDSMLAIKVLDEGIDIPEIKNAFIIASSINRRQFIQRRGRVLRKIDGRDKIAKIWDLVVIPPNKSSDAGQKLIENEKKRIEQMSSKALNIDESEEFINQHFK